jgi:putative membrane protein insertion efficiency factor
MPWFSSRRYGRPYDPYYYGRRPGYYGRAPGSSCLRDACLLETGCCIAEGLDGNCLTLALPVMPRLLTAVSAGLLATPAPRPGGSSRSARALLAAIRVYQRDISAHRPACCRFSPSCSQYAAEAVERRGAVRGTMLALRRLVRCRPGGARGVDPVPAPA